MKKTYFLPDYGIFPNTDEDCSEKLQRLFDIVEDGSVIQFKTGSYNIFNIVYLRGKKNIRIIGNKSHIISNYDPCGPKENSNNIFHFIDCTELEIQGIFIDTNKPIGAAGEVTAIDFDEQTVDVLIYDEFPVTGFEHICATNSFDEGGSPDYALATYNNVLTEQEIETADGIKKTRYLGLDYDVVGERTVRLKVGARLASKEKCRLNIGHKINIRYEMYGHSAFTFAFCNRVLMKDVVIYSAASFGVTVEPRSSDFTFDNFCIRVNEGSKRLKAINADGIHILGLYGDLKLKNCNMEGMGDDTLNIHGLAAAVTEIEGNSLKMVGRLGQLYKAMKDCTWAAAGDELDIYDPDTFLHIGSLTVEEQYADGTLTFKNLEGKLEKGFVLANKTFYANVHIDGCTLRSTRARGVLIQSQNVLIENCYIYGMSLAAILFSPDIRFWWEVGPTKNAEIRNNVIEYCATIPTAYNEGAVVFKASHEGEITAYPAGVHNDIYIHSNLFRNIPNSAIFVSAAKNVRIEDNDFCNCCNAVRDENCEYAHYDVVTMNCEDVIFKGNRSDRGEEKLLYSNKR